MRRTAIRLALATFLIALTARAEIEITLKNTFIEKFKNRATISTRFIVDKAHKKPNSPSKDADLHVAGRASEVGLPIVAEIMNARQFTEAVAEVHEAEGSGEAIPFDGVWRLWAEHGGSSAQVQGAPLKPFKSSNPDHVFEIHPATRVGGVDVMPGFIPIEGYRTKDAAQAFQSYENLSSRIKIGSGTTTISTRMGGFNYVEFQMQLNHDPVEIEDGTVVMSRVQDLDGELLVRNRRMVFVKDTPAEEAVRDLRKGQTLHVLGIPRINLALVSWRTHNAGRRPEVLTWQLPYEIVVVGVYGPGVEVEDEEGEEEARAGDRDPVRTADVLNGGGASAEGLQP